MTSFTSKTRLTEGKLQRGLSISNLCALLLRCSEQRAHVLLIKIQLSLSHFQLVLFRFVPVLHFLHPPPTRL